MEVKINGKPVRSGWADEFMNNLVEHIGEKVAQHVRHSIPAGTKVNLEIEGEPESRFTAGLRRGFYKELKR